METNNVNRAPTETRPPSAGTVGPSPLGPSQPPARPPFNRVDSRSNLTPQSPRPAAPLQSQQRPQFQPGGPVTNPPQFAPRPGTPAPRGPISTAPTGSQQIRPQPPPLRPSGPQTFTSQQGPRPLQSPASAQPPQRAPPPNNLQFGPRQLPQFGSAGTPDGNRLPITQQSNGSSAPRPQAPGPAVGQLPRQPSQGSIKGLDLSNSYQNKPVNLDNQSISNDNQNGNKPENGIEMAGAAKGRSYSIAAAPGTPSPFKMEDDRRKSVSSIGGKFDELTSRSPGLGLIQEVKTDSKDNLLSSKDSIRSETANEVAKDIIDRPESRLSGSKMTESFIGSLPTSTPKKKTDDDDDVVLQNPSTLRTLNNTSQNQNKTELEDRSPSLTRSDDSPEPKQKPSKDPAVSQNITLESQRPKTSNIEIKQEVKIDPKKDMSVTPTKTMKSPIPLSKPPVSAHTKPNELNMSTTPSDSKKSTPRKSASAPKMRPKDGDNDSGVDESTQGNDLNGSPGSPNKKLSSKLPTKEKSNSSLKPNLSRSSSKSATPKTPENPPIEKKKVPMNKIQVGNAPSPNIKTVKSKIGSLENTTYKPGGGKIKIENRKLDFNKATPKIAAKNDAYVPSGGSKKIITTKLEWNAKSKVGSLQNAAYKPGGGDKKIETVKLDFKDKAKPKVASTINITHKPGGGAVKIENQKLEFKAQSKVGSLDNVKHIPGGGDIKIFDDKDYIKQMTGQSPMPGSHSDSRLEDYYMSLQEWSEEEHEERVLSKSRSAREPRTPRTPRALSPRKHAPLDEEEKRIQRNNERNRRASMARPMSARDPPRSACSRPRTTISQRPAFSIY